MAGMQTVRSRMTTTLITLGPDDSLRDAVALELQKKIRHLPVVEAGGRKLLGIVTDRDIKRALPSPLESDAREEYDQILDETKISRVMTKDPITVTPNTPLAEAVAIMHDRKIGGLPVVEDGKLVGIFTQTDALKICLELLQKAG